jgi:hypothetical protein
MSIYSTTNLTANFAMAHNTDSGPTKFTGVRCKRPDMVIFDKREVWKDIGIIEVGINWFS